LSGRRTRCLLPGHRTARWSGTASADDRRSCAQRRRSLAQSLRLSERTQGAPGAWIMTIDWASYDAKGYFDDMMAGGGEPREAADSVVRFLSSLGIEELRSRQKSAEAAIEGMGITFTVYGEGSSIDRAWPFDIIPRIISAREWAKTEAGLRQRLQALNLFIG